MKILARSAIAGALCALALAAAAQPQTSLRERARAFVRDLDAPAAPAAEPLAATARVAVGFSPGSAQALVLRTIEGAHKTIGVAAYSFTSRPIATALLDAKARGVKVYIVADKSQRTARYSSVRFLARHGIPVRIDTHYAIMHNKFLVVDGTTVETGSFNYTRAATLANAENVVVLTGAPRVAMTYTKEWTRLWDESTPLDAR